VPHLGLLMRSPNGEAIVTDLPAPQPFMVSHGEGSAYQFQAAHGTFPALGTQTAGRFCVIERIVPAGYTIIPHMHHLEDEAFWMLNGQASFQAGDKVMEASAGAFVYLPRDIMHSIKIAESGPAHMLVLVVPAGLEHYLEDLAAYREQSGPPDLATVAAIAAKYQITMPVPSGRQLAPGHLPH